MSFALSAPRRAGRGIRILALGAPNDPRFPALPLSRVEVQGILAAYGAGKGLLGSDASLRALEAALPRVTALHLSTHARLNPHRPEASAIMLAGGRDLDAAAIARLPLARLDLVTLAACESGRTSLAAGIGAFDFVGAFLKAGVSQVLASRTALPDDNRLFLEFHRLTSRGATPRVALQALRRTSPEARWFLTLHTTISNPGGPA